MKVHAVARVRLDGDGRVTGVEWGPVDTETNEWHTEPQIADVAEVVAALHRGDDVFALFPTSHGMMPMRRFRVVEYDNGWHTVNLDGPPTHEHEIHDMLHVAAQVSADAVVGASERPWVACLCAAWCVACRDYGATFAALATTLGAEADFAWIDIEDDADALGDLDIENFPTLLIADREGARFFGPVMPQAQAAERLIRGALAGSLASDGAEAALVERVAALVAARRAGRDTA